MAYSYDKQANGVGIPFNYTRGNPIPLDSWSLFMSLSDAETYATSNPVSYPGQVVSVIEGQTANAYIIVAGPEIADEKGGTKEDISKRKLIKLGQQSESGAEIFWLNDGGTPIN